MTVTMRDRSKEAPWGVGLTNPVTRAITISAFCPKDGQRRGEPRGANQCDDGAWYWVQVWDNPCGHVDAYEDVVKEAAALEYEAARERFNRAGENYPKIKDEAARMLRDADDEYEAAQANLAQYESSPGIPKPEYRDGGTGQ